MDTTSPEHRAACLQTEIDRKQEELSKLIAERDRLLSPPQLPLSLPSAWMEIKDGIITAHFPILNTRRVTRMQIVDDRGWLRGDVPDRIVEIVSMRIDVEPLWAHPIGYINIPRLHQVATIALADGSYETYYVNEVAHAEEAR